MSYPKRTLKQVILISLFLILSMPSYGVSKNQTEGVSENLALLSEVKVTTSYVSGWESLAAIKDGYEPKSSSDRTYPIYGNWNGDGDYGKYNWVGYEWSVPCSITSFSVYWFSDNGGLAKPTSAYVEYWDGIDWQRAGNIGLDLNKYNNLEVDIVSSKIRLYMRSNTSTGIIELKVFGSPIADCNPEIVDTYIHLDGKDVQTNSANVLTGGSVVFKPQTKGEDNGKWGWTGPDNFRSTASQVTLSNLQSKQSGTYKVTYVNSCGVTTEKYYHLTVAGSFDGSAYAWPTYNPTINYHFRQEFPTLEMPTKDLIDTQGIDYTQSDGWWTFHMGAKPKSLITETAITPMLKRMNDDFAYIRDIMGWPPDKRAKRGYRSAIYLLGSGMSFDSGTDSMQLGGWQGSINYGGESWPMVYLSYYPVYSFDPACPYNDRGFQMGGVVHEGIHSVLADLPGCKNAAWFHEGGNTWLQQEMDSRRANNFSEMGFLNAGSYIAPFMPIETYSGWLQDGSFGGPGAEGVNMSQGNQQVCTWRNLLGGVQYSNAFPVFLSNALGDGSVPWIWRYCESRVLEGIADSIGNDQIRRLIMEYRAKQAVVDMNHWTGAVKKLLNNNFGASIRAEWQPAWMNPDVWYATPYVNASFNDEGLLVPEARTTPGWSGANQIPLRVGASENEVVVEFIPLDENMSMQLCYRTRNGEIVYGQPVFGGECKLIIDEKKRPANNIVFAVVSNLNYVYEGEVTRQAHYDYRLRMVKGITHLASSTKKWFNWENIISDPTAIAVPVDTRVESVAVENFDVRIFPNPVKINDSMSVEFLFQNLESVNVELKDMEGRLLYKNRVKDQSFDIPSTVLQKGVYILSLSNKKHHLSEKIIVN